MIQAREWAIDSKVISTQVDITPDTYDFEYEPVERCLPDLEYMEYNPIRAILYHKTPGSARIMKRERKLLWHSKMRRIGFQDDDGKEWIEVRQCVWWNEKFGTNGAWDPKYCNLIEEMPDPEAEKEGKEGKTIKSNDEKTICECRRFGAIGVVKELTEKYKLAGRNCSTLFRIIKYAGIAITILVSLVFIVACITSKHIWDMFHVLRLHSFLCWSLGVGMHFATDLEKVRGDPHINMLVGLTMVYFYSAAVTWVTCEAHATFKAFTSGIISARNKVYYPFGYGTPLIPIGVLILFFNDNLGTEPRCFIAWDMLTKVVFFIYLLSITIIGLGFAVVIWFNMNKPQTKRKNVIPDLNAQAKGTMLATLFMFLFWSFGAYNYVRPQQSEWPDLYCYFSLVLGWFGIVMFVFYGVMSQRFRKGISGKYAQYQAELRDAMSGKQKNTDDATSELGTSSEYEGSTFGSRPATAKSSLHEEPLDDTNENEQSDEKEVAADAVSQASNGSNGSEKAGSEGEGSEEES